MSTRKNVRSSILHNVYNYTLLHVGRMGMIKAIKVMLLPNNVQKTKLHQYAGAARFAYNWALSREKENYEKGGKFLSDSELRKEFTKLRHTEAYASFTACFVTLFETASNHA